MSGLGQDHVIGGNGRTIAVVDDERDVRQLLAEAFVAHGYAVVEADSGPALRALLDRGVAIDLITLDLNLGGEDGLATARRLRERHNVPIVMITSRVSPTDRVTGLENGADDYIIKPFHVREVMMRVENVLHRYALETPRVDDDVAGADRLAFDGCLVDFRRDRLHVGSPAETELTNAEAQVLKLLISNPGRILSRDDINLALKGRKWSPLDRTIDSVVARLRKKIERGGGHSASIKTVWGVGYTFVGTAGTPA